jgi:hypothetical protein
VPRNGSGTFTPSIDFTTEAASPPIEISKLDTVLDDIGDALTASIAADGQTAPTADIPLNGHKLTGVGAPTALTDAVTATTIIDQELQYFVDSGSANTYVITPSPAIAAYEEGQRFVVRIANASTGASTLNVNSLGAIAIQHADGSAISSGDLAAGGIFEFTYDANTTPDRWVLTSPASQIADGMLSSNIPLLNASNTFTGAAQTISANANPSLTITDADSAVTLVLQASGGGQEGKIGTTTSHFLSFYTNNVARGSISNSGAWELSGTLDVTGAVTAATIASSTSTTLVAGQLHFIDGDATLPNLTAGQWIQVINDGASARTISKNASDTTYWTLTGASVSTSFTLAARGVLTARCNLAGTAVYVSGSGITGAT